MDEGVRETLCSSCCHRYVCAHKNDYLNMVQSLQEMFYKFPKNEREFMYFEDPDCKFYSKESSTPRFLTCTEYEHSEKHRGGNGCAKTIEEEARNAMEKQAYNLY